VRLVDVRIPTPLRSYTRERPTVTAHGDTVADVLDDLDRQFPGIKFRVVDERGQLRQHMVVWIDGERCRDLTTPTTGLDELVLMQALSGG